MTEILERGALYVVSTPIGNLQDISARAVHVLRSVDLIAAEDTRTTGNLLRHLGIGTPLTSFHAHNEARRSPRLAALLGGGRTLAVVTDAGTPGISDPAYTIIRDALAAGARVFAVPGASALLAALVVSGLPMDRFVFEGFLPVKKGRRTRLAALRGEERTLVFYEAPHRILRTVRDLLATLGDRRVAVARELTKKFEDVERGTLADVLARLERKEPRGEYVIVLAGGDGEDPLRTDTKDNP